MRDQQGNERKPRRRDLRRLPLFRLLAINLAVGVAMAALLVGGLLALDPGGLRHLIFADSSPGTALGLLLFGFVVTFGSTAMGTAIMAMGRAADDEKQRGPPAPAAQPAHAMARARRAARVRQDASAKFCGFDNQGHCLVAPETQRSVAALWQSILASQQKGRSEAGSGTASAA